MTTRMVSAHGKRIKVTTITHPDRPRKQGGFVQLPVSWVIHLAGAPASAWVVATQLLYLHFKSRKQPVKLTNQPITALSSIKISRASKWRALVALEKANLISIERRGNKSPTITLHL